MTRPHPWTRQQLNEIVVARRRRRRLGADLDDSLRAAERERDYHIDCNSPHGASRRPASPQQRTITDE
jgi:hypothetical protein